MVYLPPLWLTVGRTHHVRRVILTVICVNLEMSRPIIIGRKVYRSGSRKDAVHWDFSLYDGNQTPEKEIKVYTVTYAT